MSSRARHHQQQHQRSLRGEMHRTRAHCQGRTSNSAHRQVQTNNTARTIRPMVANRQRGATSQHKTAFNAPEVWHDPHGMGSIRYVMQHAGEGYIHPVTIDEVRQRVAQLPECFTRQVQVVQFSAMTRKRSLFPLYGMQWGPNVYLYPIEASLQETYRQPPSPQQLIEAQMYGGQWTQDGRIWTLTWTPETIRDFYLNNVLIHEIGHVNDQRNTNSAARERYANWFATEYGYRVSRGRV